MKKSLKHMMVSLAAVVVTSTAAYAGDVLTANVPFTFQMGGTELAAGKYNVGTVAHQTGIPVFRVRDIGTGKAKMLMPQNAAKDVEHGKARLIFRCGEVSGCTIASMWTGTGNGWEFRTPKLRADERERLAVIFLNRNQAD